MQIFNIGYERRSVADFCRALVTAKVQLLIDVRAIAWSQRPEYRKTALQNALSQFGVSYVHCKGAGNPFRPKPGEALDWLACGTKYAQHLEAHPEVLVDLWELTKGNNVALFCYEGQRETCHRSIILKAMTKERPSLKVIDL